MPLYDTNLTSGDMLLDGDYAPPAAADVVAFWQAPNVSLDWIRPVEPFDGEVDVPRGENVRAHLLGDYGAPTYSSIAMTMNTEALQVDVTTAPGGIYVARVLSERNLEPDGTSGDCEIHVEGTEATAGAQTEDWAFGLRDKPSVFSLAAGELRVRPVQTGDAAGEVRIRFETVGKAAGEVGIRLLLVEHTEAVRGRPGRELVSVGADDDLPGPMQPPDTVDEADRPRPRRPVLDQAGGDPGIDDQQREKGRTDRQCETRKRHDVSIAIDRLLSPEAA